MNWNNTDVPEEFKLFKQRMELCLQDNDVQDPKKQAIKIKIAVGNEGLRRINASGLSNDDQENPALLWSTLEGQLKVKLNFRIHRLELMRYRQHSGETIDEFVNRCRSKAKECDFTENELSERVTELVIASTPNEAFQKDLLDQPKGYKIEELLGEGRKYEAIAVGKQCLRSIDSAANNVDALSHNQAGRKKCGNCDLNHPPRKCPAYKDTCKSCGSKGHWAKCCRKAKHRKPFRGRSQSRGRQGSNRSFPQRRQNTPPRHPAKQRVAEVSKEPGGETHDDFEEFHTIVLGNDEDARIDSVHQKEAFVKIGIICPSKPGQHILHAKVDTGASGNTLPLRTIKAMYGSRWQAVTRPTTARLTAYNGSPIHCVGTLSITCKYKDSEWRDQVFYVVDVSGPVIIGLPMCSELQVVTIHEMHHQSRSPTSGPPPLNSVKDLQALYPEQFDRIGNFHGEATLHVREEAAPTIDPPRKCSVHIKDKLKSELDSMEKQGIIRKVEHHTDWCSSITTVLKKDGSLRVCLDPRRLNQNLKRCPHKIPTLEELNPTFSGAKHFSKLDAKSGYWSVHLSKESQELTTFRTPFGRYCYTRLPFGLSVSQDLFQQHMDRIVGQAEGCICIADDIAVVGRTEAEHDKNLHRLMEVAQREGLVFNSKKCIIKTDSINFFGSVYTRDGIRPDPQKIEDIHAMPTPQDKEDLQKCLGLLNYLAPHIANFSEKASPLRELLKRDVPFTWQDDHQHAFNQLKKAISAESCLQYYNPKEKTTLEVDASMKGLGACLMQDGKPVAFASKSLSPCQANYSNIERETLALVFGIQRFHTYLFGNQFDVETDHKPLEMITRKPLRCAPPGLQRLLIKIQGYDFDVRYKPGKSMIISDALSRMPNPDKNQDVQLDVNVEEINSHIDLIFFAQKKRDELQHETSRDPTLRALWKVVTNGWPDTIKEVPTEVRTFWPYRDEIGVSNGVLFKGNQVIIPTELRQNILNQLHQGHQGIERTRRLARETVYWPKINNNIERVIKNCCACQENQTKQQREPLQPHDIPTSPWTKLGTDLFTFNKEEYLLVTDYHSKYPIVRKLHNTSSMSVANILSGIFSLFGPPTTLVSDNGPQFVGKSFREMCEKWSIDHITSSPRYPRSNGLAERMVQTVKGIMTKCTRTGQDIQTALLHFRATPIDSNLPSPAELLFGRPIRTTLPSHHLTRQSSTPDLLFQRQEKMKHDHDVHSRELPPLHVGQKVRVLDPKDNTWLPAEVSKVRPEPRSYEVATPNGSILRRNRSHLREMPNGTTQKQIVPKRVHFEDDSDRSEVMRQSQNKTQTHKQRQHHTSNTRSDTTHYTTRYGREIRRPSRYHE